MEKKARARIILLGLVGGLVGLAQRPFSLLIVSLVAYFYSEPLFGVTPLRPDELVGRLSAAKEATIAAAGLVIAIASVTAFKHAKRLDLELSLSSDISAISSEASKVLSRYALYCENILELKARYASRYDRNMHKSQLAQLDEDLAVDWQVLLRWAREIDDERDAVWSLVRQISHLGEKHQAVLGSRIITPFLIDRAQHHIGVIARSAIFPVPKQDQDLHEYIRAFMLFGVSHVRAYIEVDRQNRMKVMGFLGGASSIGSNSIAPRSLLNSVWMGWKIWTM